MCHILKFVKNKIKYFKICPTCFLHFLNLPSINHKSLRSNLYFNELSYEKAMPEAEYKEFKSRLEYGWFHLNTCIKFFKI